MDFNLIEEYSLFDVNWYFRDFFNRLCVVASGGGILPKFLLQNENQNDQFNQMVYDLPERYNIERNPAILEVIVDLKNDDLNRYFLDFDSLAKRGFFVYDKVDIGNPEDSTYVLVAYPIYKYPQDTFPISQPNLKLIPRLDKILIFKHNDNFSRENFKVIDLISLLDNSKLEI